MVGAENGVLVVLDDEDGVTRGDERSQRSQKEAVVADVEADGGLVEHVADACQARSQLGGETHPLGFSARERRRGARELEVREADLEEEAEASLELLDNGGGDLDRPSPRSELALPEGLEKLEDLSRRPACDLVNRAVLDADGPGDGVEAAAAARGAATLAAELSEVVAKLARKLRDTSLRSR